MSEKIAPSRTIVRLIERFPAGFGGRLAWQYGGSIVVVLCGFLYTIMLARHFGAMLFGTFALAIAIATLCMQLFHGNMRDFMIRYIAKGLQQNNSEIILVVAILGIAANVVLMIFFYGLFYLSKGALSRLIGQPRDFEYILAIAAFTPILQIGLSDSFSGVLRALNHVQDLALITATTAALRLTTTWIAISFLDVGIVEILWISAGSLLVGLFAFAARATIRLRRRNRSTLSAQSVRRFFTENEPLPFVRRNYYLNLLSLPTKELDTVILGMVATVENVGIYRLARNFMNAVCALSDPIHLVIYPELARLWNLSATKSIRDFVHSLAIALLTIAVLVVFVGGLLASPVIDALAGAEFADSALLFQIMLASLLFWLPLAWVHPAFLASGRNDLSVRAAIVQFFISAGLFSFLGYAGGTLGIAFAYSIGLALYALLQLYLLRSAKLLGTHDRSAIT